ncbi:MAG: hypothetical protein NZO16_03880 [Deltaproteobacteria bacterium]|nr:hypothetical protein [Deltaproteobacteria bacterium]
MSKVELGDFYFDMGLRRDGLDAEKFLSKQLSSPRNTLAGAAFLNKSFPCEAQETKTTTDKQLSALRELSAIMLKHDESQKNAKPVVEYSDKQKEVLSKAARGITLTDYEKTEFKKALREIFKAYSELRKYDLTDVDTLLNLNKLATEARLYHYTTDEHALHDREAFREFFTLLLKYGKSKENDAAIRIFSLGFAASSSEMIKKAEDFLQQLEQNKLPPYQYQMKIMLAKLGQLTRNMAQYFADELNKNPDDRNLIQDSVRFFALANLCFPLESTNWMALNSLREALLKIQRENKSGI